MNAKCNQEIEIADLLPCLAYVEDQSDCIIVLCIDFVQFYKPIVNCTSLLQELHQNTEIYEITEIVPEIQRKHYLSYGNRKNMDIYTNTQFNSFELLAIAQLVSYTFSAY